MKTAHLRYHMIEEDGVVKELVRWVGGEGLPCYINASILVVGHLPWPVKVVGYREWNMQALCCRTDAYPLMWVWWWLAYRLEETARLIGQLIVMIGMVWGFAYAAPGERLSLCNQLFKRKPKDD